MAQREIRIRDAFLWQVSQGLARRVAELGACQCRGADALRGFSRELSIICGDREALVPRRKPMDLGSWIGRVARRWQKRFEGRTQIRVTHAGETRAAFDPDLLESVVAELLSNALKYGGGKPVQVHVARHPKSIRITIADQGAGLRPDPSRGRRFARGAHGANAAGFGIGIWLTRRLVRAHGGRFRLVSCGSGGTLAIVELPVHVRRKLGRSHRCDLGTLVLPLAEER